jgi:hypothetical protein
MTGIQNYLLTRWPDITLVVLFLFIGLIIMVLNNISFKTDDDDVKSRKLEEVIIIEGMNGDGDGSSGTASASVKVSDVESNLNKSVSEPEQTLFDKIQGGFCHKYQGKSHLLEEHCNKLAKGVCKVSGCCVLAHDSDDNSNKCVAGNALGPTFLSTDDGTDLNFDYYYYKNKCYGKNCGNT